MSSNTRKQPPGSQPQSRRLFLSTAALAAAAASTSLASRPAAAEATASSDVGAVWWSELQAADPARARAFYSAVMGWTPKVVALTDQTRAPEPGEKEYTLFNAGDREVAGALQAEAASAQSPTSFWLTYIQVANVDAAALKAVELGGKLLEAPTDIPNSGRIAIIQDPEGAHVGLITPVSTASG